MDNIATDTAVDSPRGKIPLWIFVVFISTLLVALTSLGISQYQKTQEANQEQNTNAEAIELSILAQDDVISANWLHTLNPLVKDVKGSLIWSSKEQQGVIKLFNLPNLEDNQHYRLWIYDLNAKSSEPVSTLSFISKFDNLFMPFVTERIIDSPFKFEIMLEEEGVEGGQSLLFAQP